MSEKEGIADQLLMRLNAVQEQNLDLMKNVALQGGQQFVTPGEVALIKVQALIETVLDQEGQIAVELAFEMKMNEALSQLLVELNKAKLTQNVPVPGSGLIVPQ